MWKVTEGLVYDVRKELIEQLRDTSVGRLVVKNHYAYKVPAMYSKMKGRLQRTCKVCADISKHQTGKAVKKFTVVYCPKCDVGLCLGDCFETYHTREK
jgi:hypothetical protein